MKTSEGEIFHAGQVVLAAGCWSSQIPDAAPYAPTLPVRGQMAALRHSGTPIRHVLRSERGYLVPRGLESPQTVVVGSTIENAGYEKRVTSGGMEKILSAANELAPELAQRGNHRDLVRLAARHAGSIADPGPGGYRWIGACNRPLPQRNSAGSRHGEAHRGMDHRAPDVLTGKSSARFGFARANADRSATA